MAGARAMTDVPAIRRRLPNRRAAEIRVIEFGGRKIYVTVGFDPTVQDAAPRILEVFLRGKSKVGAELDFLYDDIAVLLSTSLQYGLTPRGIRRHLGAASLGVDDAGEQRAGGQPMSLIAAVVDELIVLQDELVDAWRAAQGLPPLHPQPKATP
jgi:hypothetical protein